VLTPMTTSTTPRSSVRLFMLSLLRRTGRGPGPGRRLGRTVMRHTRLEQAADSRIAGYVATLQMRLSRLLADGRYDFITRIEEHEDPLSVRT
jgi:hypothetical protein